MCLHGCGVVSLLHISPSCFTPSISHLPLPCPAPCPAPCPTHREPRPDEHGLLLLPEPEWYLHSGRCQRCQGLSRHSGEVVCGGPCAFACPLLCGLSALSQSERLPHTHTHARTHTRTHARTHSHMYILQHARRYSHSHVHQCSTPTYICT